MPFDAHLDAVRACRRCPGMVGQPVVGRAVTGGRVYLVGQAPGPREQAIGRPFAWTAGRTLFSWFASIGLDEPAFRSRVFMAAVCRCFPGKANGGGDRVPNPGEIANCSEWMAAEMGMLDPELILPVGRLAIAQFLPPAPLEQIVGQIHRVEVGGRARDVLPLPHPSGASTWFRMEPGRTRLAAALGLLAAHPEWRRLLVE
ncbi:MAG: uracil-DNA glycosylase family protein [Pseudomonadota bacterium]|nr:uracil-DNA glycosylase family protein [Pseudomonadota bacterium]